MTIYLNRLNLIYLRKFFVTFADKNHVLRLDADRM